MRHHYYYVLSAIVIAVVCACATAKDEVAAVDDFAKGADIGWVTEMEDHGDIFRTAQGDTIDCFQLMKDYGLNAVRLRVWVNPEAHGNYCDKNDLLAKCLRAQALDMDIMVDFHYSDWWADPGQQHIPAAWVDYSLDEMKAAVAEHTTDVLSLLKANDVTPKWVQVGNETTHGFLWEMGRAEEHPEQYAALFAAGYDAVKSIFPEAIVIVHLDNGFDQELYDWNLAALRDNGAQWDMVGMSLYPFWAQAVDPNLTPEGVITDCIANIRHVAETFNCDVMIVETGMECADDNGNLASDSILNYGREQLARIICESRDSTDSHCKGVFYWEPECQPSKYRLGAFTEDGRPTAIMDAFKDN